MLQHDAGLRPFLVDLSLPLTIGAADAEAAADLTAYWFAGLRRRLGPGLLYSHAVRWERPIFGADLRLTLRLNADTEASAISRVPEFSEALNCAGSALHVGDWRGRVRVRASGDSPLTAHQGKRPCSGAEIATEPREGGAG